jgi:hypothetical protein
MDRGQSTMESITIVANSRSAGGHSGAAVSRSLATRSRLALLALLALLAVLARTLVLRCTVFVSPPSTFGGSGGPLATVVGVGFSSVQPRRTHATS